MTMSLIATFSEAVGEDSFGRPAKPVPFASNAKSGSIFSARR
jgi:hypothetical protein